MGDDDDDERPQWFLLNGGSSSVFDPLSVPNLIVKNDFLGYLESLDERLLSPEDCADWERLFLGVSALQLFLQCNVVGPIPVLNGELHARISGVVSRALPAADSAVECSSRSALNLDGESAYPPVRFPQLLLLAKHAFSAISTISSVDWWRLRVDRTHQLTLQEPVETLRSSVVDTLIPRILASPFFAHLSSPHRVLFYLEAYHAYHYYSRSKDAARCLDAAVSLAGVDLRVTGALGKRTKWQREDKPQLVVAVGPDGGDSNVEKMDVDEWWFAGTTDSGDEEATRDIWWHSDAPKDIALDDDTLLDKVKFQRPDDVETKSRWTPVEQAVVFCVMMDVGRRSCVRELTEEELSAFRAALLDQEKKIFGVQAGCLFYRSGGEREKSRKVERALMQLEDLTNSLKRFDAEISSTPTGHRVFLAHALCLPFIWTVETLMADVMTSLGLTSAALDVYLRLEAWTNVVDCYKKQGKRGAAEKLIREKFDLTKDPNMLCVLGDVTLEPSHYEEAWRLSKGTCARAMRTLGYDHLYKHRSKEAIECFEKSIAVNALQIPVWYSLGCTALLIDDNKMAEKAFLRCVHLDYDNYEAWTNLASAQVKLGFKDKACNTLQEALKCNYENWRIWENFLVVSADVGRAEDVMRAYHRLLDLKGEKYVDSEVLTVLVMLVVKLRESFEPEDEPNRLAFQKLEKKCRELFGRVTSSVTDNADIWRAYGGLYLSLRPFISPTRDSNDDPDRRMKGVQFLQRSLRCLTQKSGWELQVITVEETLRKSDAIVQQIFDEDDNDVGDCGGATAAVTVASLSSLKMVVKTTVVKIDKKYGEAGPSEDAKAEVVKMKTNLTAIEERISRKKAKEQ